MSTMKMLLQWPYVLEIVFFLILLLIITFIFYRFSKHKIQVVAEERSRTFGLVQKNIMDDLAIPFCITDLSGRILWMNREFQGAFESDESGNTTLTDLIPQLKKEMLPDSDRQSVEMNLVLQDRDYRLEMRQVSPEEISAAGMMPERSDTQQAFIGVCLYDETDLNEAIRMKHEESLILGLIYIDNYDEVTEGIEEVRQALLIALIDRKVSQYLAEVDGIARKMERDKYFIMFKQKYYEDMKEDRFSLLEDVKSINVGNEIAPTLSIGIGADGDTYGKKYDHARMAINLALGRGGDQAVIKEEDNMLYFGGKTQQMLPSTRVKARVKAEALQEFISGAGQIIVMGHRIPDVDCFGAAMGIYRIAKNLGKRIHVVMDEATVSVKPLLELFQDNEEYEEDLFVTSEKALQIVDEDTMVIVVDTNRPGYTQCPELLKSGSKVVVIDHHRAMPDAIQNAVLSYVEPYSSSASEMVAEIMQYIREDTNPGSAEANCLYAGIIIDTNNFTTKTGVRTFEAAAYLRRNGADIIYVRKLFRDDFESYQAKAETIRQAEIYRDHFAIAVFPENPAIKSPTVVGSQAANELLNISEIKASFVLTAYQDAVFISARSIDEVNVQLIMERLGGGGHMSTAGAQLERENMNVAIQRLKKTLDLMIERGELE